MRYKVCGYRDGCPACEPEKETIIIEKECPNPQPEQPGSTGTDTTDTTDSTDTSVAETTGTSNSEADGTGTETPEADTVETDTSAALCIPSGPHECKCGEVTHQIIIDEDSVQLGPKTFDPREVLQLQEIRSG